MKVVHLFILYLFSFLSSHAQRTTLINTDKVLLKNGGEISIGDLEVRELLSVNTIGGCADDNGGGGGVPLYDRVFADYFYYINYPAIIKNETENKLRNGFVIDPIVKGIYPIVEGYDRLKQTETCIDGNVYTNENIENEVSIGIFKVKIIEFEKTYTDKIIALKDGDVIDINRFYLFSDGEESDRLKFSTNAQGGIFNPINVGEETVSINADFDNGSKSLDYAIDVLEFKLTQSTPIELCELGTDLIDLRNYHTLFGKEGITFSYEGNGIVRNYFLDPEQLAVGSNVIKIKAKAINGSQELSVDFVKRNVEADAGENQFVCHGSTLTLTGNSTSGGVWTSPDITIIDGNKIETNSIDPGTYNVTYTITSGPCTGRDTKQIEVLPSPILQIGEDVSVCQSLSTYTLDGAIPSGGEWLSENPNLIIADGLINLQLLDIAEVGFSDYTVTYRYTNANNCTSEASKVLRVFSAPKIPVLKSSTICGTGQANIEIENFDPSFVYEWYKENQKLIGESGQRITTGTLTTSTNYKVIARSPFLNTCSDVGEIDVTVVTPPSKPIVQEDTRCGAGKVTLRAGGVPGAVYRWYNTNDILLYEGDSYETEIAQTSDFYVSAVLNGCEGEKEKVTATSLFEPPIPFIANENRCGPGSISVTASGAVSGGEYVWYSSQSASTPFLSRVPTYTTELSESTKVYVAVRMQDTGCESKRKEVELQILPIPAIPNIQDAYFCEGTSGISLEIENPTNGYTYEWYSQFTTVPIGLLATGIRFFTGQLTNSAFYYIRAVSTKGCQSQIKEAKVSLVKDEPLDIGSDTVVCLYGDELSLEGDLPEIFRGQGYFTGPGVFERTFKQASLADGIYSVSFQASLGGCPIQGERNIEVKSGAKTATLPIDEAKFTLCPEKLPYDLRLFTQEYPYGTFSGNSVNGNSFTAPQEGSYEILYTLDTAGCIYESNFDIKLLGENTQVPVVVPDEIEYCAGDIAVLEAKSNGVEEYHWYLDNNLETKVYSGQKFVTAAADQALYVVSEDVNGCNSLASDYTIPIRELPTEIQSSLDTIEIGGFVEFTAHSANSTITNEILLSWDFGNGEVSNQTTPAVFYHRSGNFTVSLQVQNGHCIDTLYKDIMVKSDTLIDLVTSIEKIGEISPLLYPQPVNDQLYIEIPHGLWEYTLYDMQGKVLNRAIIRTSSKIATSQWQSGMYLLKLENGKDTFHFKILKL